MSLMNKIAKNIEASVLEFTRLVADKYDLDQDTLMDMWTDITKMKTKISKAKKPPSAYQIFSAEQRALIKQEEPDMAFGDIAKEIGKRWRKLSSEEKAAYASSNPVKTSPEKKSKPVMASATAMPSGSDDLHSLSKARLLEMCAAKGIKIAKSKSKDQIIAAIQEADEADAVSSDEASVAGSDDDNASVAKSVEASEEEDNVSVAVSDKTLDEEEEEDPIDMRAMYEAMKIKDLAEICKEKGLPSKGSKETMIKRLLIAA